MGVANDGTERPDQQPGRTKHAPGDPTETPAAAGGEGIGVRSGTHEAIAGRRKVGVGKLGVAAAVAEERKTRQPTGEFDRDGIGPFGPLTVKGALS